MEYVKYEGVTSDYELQPTFKLDKSKNIPFLDYTDINSPNYNIGTSSNLYDDLLNDLHISNLLNSTVQDITHIGKFNINAAIDKLHSNVGTHLKTGKPKDPKTSGHMCARAVRMAMEAGGLSTNGRPNYGGYYGSFLKKNGWVEVSGTPQKGDIAVTRPYGKHTGGHISMFDGSQWVSDYILRDISVYGPSSTAYTTIYRYSG